MTSKLTKTYNVVLKNPFIKSIFKYSYYSKLKVRSKKKSYSNLKLRKSLYQKNLF